MGNGNKNTSTVASILNYTCTPEDTNVCIQKNNCTKNDWKVTGINLKKVLTLHLSL